MYHRYGADPRDPPTREALARTEGRSLEGVSREDIARDAEAIEQLMEIVLQKERRDTDKKMTAERKNKTEAEQAKNKKVGWTRSWSFSTTSSRSGRSKAGLPMRRRRESPFSRMAKPVCLLVAAAFLV